MTTAVPNSQRTLILGLLCVASFAVVFNNLIITPILPDISEELNVRVAVAGLLVTAYAIVGGVTAIFSGPIIDRLGRKPVVVTGMSILTIATGLSAITPGFYFLLGARALAGLGVACLTPAVFAAVGDYFSYEERGKAMSWVISANTSASILGVPAGALVSGLLSWRWTFVLLTAICLLFSFLLFSKLPKETKRSSENSEGLSAILNVVRDGRTFVAILSNYLSTSYWFVFATYMGAYFHDKFGVAKWALGGLTMTMGLGVLLGSNVGGRLADSRGKRPVLIYSGAICAVLITLITTVSTHPAIGVGLLFAFATSMGARFASAQTVVSEMAPTRRGTVMALNASGQQFGIVTGSALGGFVLDLTGYTGLGPTAGVIAVISVVTYALAIDESKFASQESAELAPAAGGQ